MKIFYPFIGVLLLFALSACQATQTESFVSSEEHLDYKLIDSRGQLLGDGNLFLASAQPHTSSQNLTQSGGYVLQGFEAGASARDLPSTNTPDISGFTAESDATAILRVKVRNTTKPLSIILRAKQGERTEYKIDAATDTVQELMLEVPLNPSVNPHRVLVVSDTVVCQKHITNGEGGENSMLYTTLSVESSYPGFSIRDNKIFHDSKQVGSIIAERIYDPVEDVSVTGVERLENGDYEYSFTEVYKEAVTKTSTSSSFTFTITLGAGTRITSSRTSSDDILAGLKPTLECNWIE